MIVWVIVIIAVISILLALFSLWRQNKLGEVKRAKKELKRQKVIFYSTSQKHH